MSGRRMSDEGRKMLVALEGKESCAYRDVVGYWTIGVGHMLTKDELTSGKIVVGSERIKWRRCLSDEQIDALLWQDLGRYEDAVFLCVKVPLNQNEFDALVSMCFNIGTGALCGSTLVKHLNQGRKTEVPEQMRHWIYAGGQIVDGLVKRREVEIGRWNAVDALA